MKTVVAAGKPVTRSAVRDAIQAVKLPDSLLGAVAFDANGDGLHGYSVVKNAAGSITFDRYLAFKD